MGAEKRRPPKRAEQGQTIGEALAHIKDIPKGNQAFSAKRRIVELFGSLPVRGLSARHVHLLNAWLETYANRFTRHRRAAAVRHILRDLWELGTTGPLHKSVLKVSPPKPRNVTATLEERRLILDGSSESLRCWLMLCSDLAIRSGTARLLGPTHFDEGARTLTFRTKYGNAQTLPVPEDLARLLAKCKDPSLPFVAQLDRGKRYKLRSPSAPLTYRVLCQELRAVKKRVGITRKLTPHDLRRTTARAVYALTHDLRVVQALLGHSDLKATAWYLQNDLITVPVSALELARLNPTTEAIQ